MCRLMLEERGKKKHKIKRRLFTVSPDDSAAAWKHSGLKEVEAFEALAQQVKAQSGSEVISFSFQRRSHKCCAIEGMGTHQFPDGTRLWVNTLPLSLPSLEQQPLNTSARKRPQGRCRFLCALFVSLPGQLVGHCVKHNAGLDGTWA